MNASTEIQHRDCGLISPQRDDFGATSASQERTQNTRCNNTYNSGYMAAFAEELASYQTRRHPTHVRRDSPTDDSQTTVE